MHISDGQVLLGTLKFLFFTMFFLSKKFVLKVFLQYALPKVFASLSAIYFSGFLLAMMDFFFFLQRYSKVLHYQRLPNSFAVAIGNEHSFFFVVRK